MTKRLVFSSIFGPQISNFFNSNFKVILFDRTLIPEKF